MNPIKESLHAFTFAVLATLFLFGIHCLPVNQLFIDPFSEAIKNHDIMDVAFSQFRNHSKPELFDEDVLILNSEKTNRSEIAQTINFLAGKNVGGIGVDLIFDSLNYNKEDTILANALSNEKVVLGYSFIEDYNNHKGKGTQLGQHSHEFFIRTAHEGYVNLGSDDGFSVRTFEPFHDVDGEEEMSFSLQLVKLLDPKVDSVMKDRNHRIEWINFRRKQPGVINQRYPINERGDVHYAFTTVREFLEDTSSYDPSFFEGKIVLIGFAGEDDNAFSMNDRYFTPLNEKYNGRSLPDMFGVTVHANILSMIMDRDFINEVPEIILYLVAFLIYFVNYLIFKRLAKKKLFLLVPVVRVIQLLQFVFLFSACVLFIVFFNVKFGFIIIITAVILSFELFEFYAHKLRNKIATRINRIIE